MRRSLIFIVTIIMLATMLVYCIPLEEDVKDPDKKEVVAKEKEEGGVNWYWKVVPYFALTLLLIEVILVTMFFKQVTKYLEDSFVKRDRWGDITDNRWKAWIAMFALVWVLSLIWIIVLIVGLGIGIYFWFLEDSKKVNKIKDIIIGKDDAE